MWRKKGFHLFALFSASLFGFSLLTSSTHAAQLDASLRPNPLVFELAVGEEKTLDIVIENAVEIYGIDVSGTFNKNAVEVVDANLSRPGVQLVPGSIPKPDFVVINTADNDLGTFQYVITEINPSEPMSGSGTVFSIKLRGEGIGTSELTISSVQAADRNGVSIPITKQNSTIKVQPNEDFSYIYMPIVHR